MGSISLPFEGQNQSRKSSRSPLLLLAAIAAGVLYLHSSPLNLSSDILSSHSSTEITNTCPFQPDALPPNLGFLDQIGELQNYTDETALRLARAVRFDTQSFDDNGPPLEDPRWKGFFEFQKWLFKTYATVFESDSVTVEFVNTLGLLVTVKGSDPNLKPLLLLSHQDSVPAPLDTYDRWTYPPHDGVYADGIIWGRGSLDQKNLLLAQYEALTLLFNAGFEPTRTIILSHGFDEEEVFARQGAGTLAPFLEQRYGFDSMLIVVDEGGSGIKDDAFGRRFAVPAAGEKGYLDVQISVGTLGGHSSRPPAHSGIGIMADIVHALEANPYEFGFASEDPFISYLNCASKYSPDFPSDWKPLVGNPGLWGDLATKYANMSIMNTAEVHTIQAIDVIKGGVKVNSLPELVTMQFNHRIAFFHSVGYVQGHIEELLKPIADEFGMEFEAWAAEKGIGNTIKGERFVKIETMGLPLEPRKKSPTSGPLWETFAGTIKAAFQIEGDDELIVSPYSTTGNTDTKVYHNLSQNVFRFTGALDKGGANAHTVDEYCTAESHVKVVEWVFSLIQNMDSYTGPE